MFAYALTISPGPSCCFRCSRSSANTSCPGSAAAPACGRLACCFSKRCCSAIRLRHFSTSGERETRRCCTWGCLPCLALLRSTRGQLETQWPAIRRAYPACLPSIWGCPISCSPHRPLMQQWFSQTNLGRSPYRLYALSNVARCCVAQLSVSFSSQPSAPGAGQPVSAASAVRAFCATALAAARTPVRRCRAPRPPARKPGSCRAVAWDKALCSSCRHRLVLCWPRPTSSARMWRSSRSCGLRDLYLLTFIICFDNPRWTGAGCSRML